MCDGGNRECETMKTVDVLGTTYTIEYKEIKEDAFLEDVDGYCDHTAKLIVIKSENNNNLKDFARLQRKNLRHELIHAFLGESGLQANFQHANQFGHDETMVDWFAIQFPKLQKIFRELGIED